jgi:hypothetical protein
MPPPTQTTDLEEAATAHSVNEDEFGNNIYKTLRITGMDLEDEDGPGQQPGKSKRKKARVIVETVVRKGMVVGVSALSSTISGARRVAVTLTCAFLRHDRLSQSCRSPTRCSYRLHHRHVSPYNLSMPLSQLILEVLRFSLLFQLLIFALDGAFHFRLLVRLGRSESKYVDLVPCAGTRVSDG